MTDGGTTLIETLVIARRFLGDDFLKNDGEAATAGYATILLDQLVKYYSVGRDQPKEATVHPHIARAKNAIIRALAKAPRFEPESERFSQLALGIAFDYVLLRAPDVYPVHLSEENRQKMKTFTARPWLRATSPAWLEEHMPTSLAELRAVK